MVTRRTVIGYLCFFSYKFLTEIVDNGDNVKEVEEVQISFPVQEHTSFKDISNANLLLIVIPAQQ